MESKQSGTEDFSSAKAVLVGALAPGVNGPTWNTLKISFLMLGLCLAAMLGLAFSSSDSALVLHVTFLVLITGTLFLLLTRQVVFFGSTCSCGLVAGHLASGFTVTLQFAVISCRDGARLSRTSNAGDWLSSRKWRR